VWTEGSQVGTAGDNPNGNVRLKFKWGSGAWTLLTVWPYLQEGDPKGYDPSVALHGDVAHVVWAVKTADAVPNYVIYYLGWNLGTNRCAKNPNASVDICREQVSKSNSNSKTYPQIAVDANGVPHVVWAEKPGVEWHIYYDNRNGDTWWDDPRSATDERISSLTPSAEHFFEHTHPVIAADDRYVYVAWDLDDRATSQCWGNRSGIHFRLRTTIGQPADPDLALWAPPTDGEGKRLSKTGGQCATGMYGWPTIDVEQGRAYAMWQYLRDEQDLGAYSIYTYSLQYRVFTGTTDSGEQVWWPSIAAGAYESPDEVAWDSTSLYAETSDHAYYSGLRPSIDVVGSGGVITPHVVWHAWTPPAGGGGGGERLASVGPQASEEPYVTQQWPYRVYYAYARYAIPGEFDSIDWIDWPITVTVGQWDRILSWPDVAIVHSGGRYDPHFAVHRRSSDKTDFKTVWYSNLDTSFWAFLPGVFRQHAAR